MKGSSVLENSLDFSEVAVDRSGFAAEAGEWFVLMGQGLFASSHTLL